MKKLCLILFTVSFLAVFILSSCAQSSPVTAPVPAPTPSSVPAVKPSPATGQSPSPIQTASPPPVSAKPIKLRFATSQSPESQAYRDGNLAWAKRVEKATGGRVQIELFPGGALGGTEQSWEIVTSGVTDIVWGSTVHYAGRFPLSEVILLPFLGLPSAKVSGRVVWELYQKFPEIRAEYPNVKVLLLHGGDQYMLITAKKLVQKLEDVKGLRLRAGGKVQIDTAKAMGAVPSFIPLSDFYISLEKGIMDGAIQNWQAIDSWRLYEVTKYVLEENFSSASFWIVMNQDSWKSLPPDIQEAIMSVSGAVGAEEVSAGGWDSGRNTCLDKIKKQGLKVEVNRLPAEQMAKFNEVLKPIAENWVSEMEKKRLPGKAILNETLNLVAKYSK